MKLLTEAELIWSPIVANNRMNRKRVANGVNSYEKELFFNPSKYLDDCLAQRGEVKWLDLCCGEGNALIQYARGLAQQAGVQLKGIDLVDLFQEIPAFIGCLEFEVRSLVNWVPSEKYDLITCVHGIHYIGDKLKVLVKAIAALQPWGLFMANLDLNNIQGVDVKKLFALCGIEYNKRRKLLTCTGPRHIDITWTYVGADDQTGPNYTGQEAVTSFYR
ncbi:methyltransferase domain-containing protein [Chitinophaga sp.]|uniref:class I SAM-dependent methyltransferase n=1 Tax=Chitinophaga sp. TaxID=1869181 RepID=UPI0031E24AA4